MTTPPLPNETVELVEHEGAFQGYFRVGRYFFRHGLYQGGQSGILKREVFERGHAAAVLPYDPLRDEVVLIRQYRPGIDEVCVEIPGGMVDAGEEPMAAAARELAEETGYTSTTWHQLGVVAPNPAIQNNRLHSFLATDARPTQAQHLEGSEVIDVDTAPLSEVTAMLRDGRISDQTAPLPGPESLLTQGHGQ